MDYRDSLDIDGTCVTIRAMQPSDRDIEQRFVRELSPRSRYYRFHAGLKELTPPMLERFTHVRYPDEMALIATVRESEGERQVGVARYARYPGTDRAEVAVVVADDWQGKGIGSRLLLDLRRIAHDAGIRYLEASVLLENKRMLAMAQRLGFSIKPIRPGNGANLELGKDLDEK
jgi:acetyltransferase